MNKIKVLISLGVFPSRSVMMVVLSVARECILNSSLFALGLYFSKSSGLLLNC